VIFGTGSGAGPPPAARPQRMTVHELEQWLDGPEPLAVLDVREPVERAYAAIPLPAHAKHLAVPMNEVREHLDVIRADVGPLPLVVYCHHGVRSLSVAAWLVRQGLTSVFNLDGGIDAWSTQVDRTVPRY
jgi:rhodanese-related sulfurtransferase